MPLNWPGAFTHGGNLSGDAQIHVKAVIDEFADRVASNLRSFGLPPHASPIFRPFSLAVLKDRSKVLVGFSPATGMPVQNWIDQSADLFHPAAMADLVKNRLNREVGAVVSLPHPEDPFRTEKVNAAAFQHAREVEVLHSLAKLGDITHVRHLEGYLRQFLQDHPDPDKNFFVMMRFNETKQMAEVYEAIQSTLASRGMTAIRADERDYTGELWTNIEVYLTGCRYGIAVFEDIDQRDYNPNVSLELGYLMGRGKRTLLLKEKRLPRLPTDVVHRLYKEFDMFDISRTVEREVARWVDVDLGLP